MLTAQVSKTIHVETAGTLSTLISENEMTKILDLTVTGNIDVRDIKHIQNNITANLTFVIWPMTPVVNLDFSNATINAYTGSDGTDHHFDYENTNQVYSYPANEFPEYSFASFITAYGYSAYKSIKLPRTLTSIGDHAFAGCDGLSSVYSYTSYPVTAGSSTFTGVLVLRPCNLYIPKGSTANYTNSTLGKKFSNLIEMISSDISISTNQNKLIKIRTVNSNIIVEGTSIGETVKLYTVNGKLIQTVISKGERLNLSANRNTIYLVKIGEKIFKVIL